MTQDDLRTRFQAFIRRALRAGEERGVLGMLVNGEWVIDAPATGRVYVTVQRGGNLTVLQARNMRVQAIGGLPVVVRPGDDGVIEVVGLDGALAEQYAGAAGAAGAVGDVGPHSHRLGYGLEDLVEGKRFEPGLVTPYNDSSLNVYIEPFFYQWQDTSGVYAGGVLDLTPYVPAAGLWCWVKVGIDPVTNAATAVAGPSVAQTAPLTREALRDVALSGIPLFGVKLRAGQTAFMNTNDFEDCRPWLSVGSLAAAPPGAQYLTLAADTTLTAERVLTPGAGIAGTDAGAGSTYTLDLDINGLTAESTADDADAIAIYDNSAGAVRKQTRANFLAGITGGSAAVLSCGRLTLRSGDATPESDVLAATTLYWTPYIGNHISFYNGSSWEDAAYAEASVAIPSTTNTNYDVYIYDSGGSLAFDLVVWRNSGQAITGASNTTPIVITANAHGLSNGDTVYIQGVRGNTAANGTWTVANVTANTFELSGSVGNGSYAPSTGYFSARSITPVLQDGILVKAGATARRLYGSIRTTGTSGQCEDSRTRRLVCNIYNTEMRPFYRGDWTGHTYTGPIYRWWNNSASHYIDFVTCLGRAVYGSIACMGYAGAAGQSMTVGIDTDKATGIDSEFGWGMNFNRYYTAGGGSGAKIMLPGYHFLAVTEAGGPAGSYFNQYQLKGFVLG